MLAGHRHYVGTEFTNFSIAGDNPCALTIADNNGDSKTYSYMLRLTAKEAGGQPVQIFLDPRIINR